MKKAPNIGLTILLAMVVAVGLSFILPKDAEQLLSQRFWTQKTFAPADYDVVIMGDSRIYRGVSPEIMEEKLQTLKVLNFGYSNGGLNPEMFHAAENKLNNNNQPKVIVIGISAISITGLTQGNEQYRQELNRPREERLEAFYLNTIQYWFSPLNLEQLKKSFCPQENEAYYHSHYFRNGYVASDKFPIDTMEAMASYQDDFSKFQVEDQYVETLCRQVSDWTNQGIIVIGFRPPVPLPMRQLEENQGRYNEDQIRSDFEKAGGHWIDLDPNEYKTYDGSHVTTESVQKLSARIAEEIGDLIR